MRLALSRTLVATVARRFASQYPADTYPADNRHGAVREKLEALDLAKATAAECAEIIGNKSWTYFTCSECSQAVEQAVEIGGEYGDHQMTLCPSCLRAAAALASVVL